LDAALAHRTRIEGFLRQPVRERGDPQQADARLLELAASLTEQLSRGEGEIPDAEEVIDEDVSSTASATSLEPAIPALGMGL
jgi:hypothetical protein